MIGSLSQWTFKAEYYFYRDSNLPQKIYLTNIKPLLTLKALNYFHLGIYVLLNEKEEVGILFSFVL